MPLPEHVLKVTNVKSTTYGDLHGRKRHLAAALLGTPDT